ncbi:FUSC family protein [Phytohabitans sp. ZYX-F-186]|uniref:FUSC family protein n=1 Tax=Phytohabitans maris TaxID=3071409 RepID=A0ABU0ZI29_9ACTN|nr:FUSC family protein [Phytohabitans sp. ZYX-F-186]MDQ7906655.1 FUSC family protein [Phytohabitans sp. ZYX-F-186]
MVLATDELARRTGAQLRDRVRRVRMNVLLALQAGVAAGLAWLVAHELIGHRAPFFAPIAAVITLAVSVGQRLRRAFELVFGVAIGIAVGDLLIYLIGTGAWQIGLVVTLAIVTAIFVGGGSALITQAASSAVLVATLTPPTTSGISYERFVDALVGGLVGLGVMALLLPVNPLTVVGRAAQPALDVLAEGLTGTAEALAARDVERLEAVLARLRAAEGDLRALQEAIGAASETAALAPARWRTRGALGQYIDAADHVAHTLRNSRVLVRRALALVRDGEALPAALVEAVEALGEAVGWLRRELADGIEPVAARERALRAASEAGIAYAEGVDFSGSVIVAQVRSAAIDLVQASGLDANEAGRRVRRAVGRHIPPDRR